MWCLLKVMYICFNGATIHVLIKKMKNAIICSQFLKNWEARKIVGGGVGGGGGVQKLCEQPVEGHVTNTLLCDFINDSKDIITVENTKVPILF